MKQGIQIGFVVLALAIAGYMVVSTFSDPATGPRQGSGPTTVRVLSAADVLADYKQHATEGDAGLKDLYFVVHGTVSEVTEQSIVFDTGQSFGVECVLRDKSDLKKAEKGKEIGLAGKGAEGALANVPVIDCWVVADWQGKDKMTINIP